MEGDGVGDSEREDEAGGEPVHVPVKADGLPDANAIDGLSVVEVHFGVVGRSKAVPVFLGTGNVGKSESCTGVFGGCSQTLGVFRLRNNSEGVRGVSIVAD